MSLTEQLRLLDRTTWIRAIPLVVGAALLIAVPADLLDTPLFGRPIEPKAIDYLILTITAGLIGLILAIRAPESEAAESQERRTLWGGAFSFLAVGCPVCNQAVVALVGAGGALSWWAPVQPVVGVIAIGLLLHTLRQRLTTYQLVACPI